MKGVTSHARPEAKLRQDTLECQRALDWLKRGEDV
jgi:hypothetical protein